MSYCKNTQLYSSGSGRPVDYKMTQPWVQERVPAHVQPVLKAKIFASSKNHKTHSYGKVDGPSALNPGSVVQKATPRMDLGYTYTPNKCLTKLNL